MLITIKSAATMLRMIHTSLMVYFVVWRVKETASSKNSVLVPFRFLKCVKRNNCSWLHFYITALQAEYAHNKLQFFVCVQLTLRFKVTLILDWLVMSLMGALSISCSALWMASASIRIICQLISLNVRIWTKQARDEQWNDIVLDSIVLTNVHYEMATITSPRWGSWMRVNRRSLMLQLVLTL